MALTDAQKAKLVKLGQLGKFKEMNDGRYYQKPGTGIPDTDLSDAVQALLTAAGTALQASDLTTLEGKVAALEAYFATEADSDTIINKWVEIVAFLNNITESQTLDGIISGINTSIAAKAAKVANAVSGNFAGLDANGDLTDSGSKASDFKTKQAAVTDPTAGNATDTIEFIATASQNANGEVSLTKQAVRAASASQSGVMSAAHYSKLEAIEYATDSDIEAIFA